MSPVPVRSDGKISVLFVCIGNSCRSIMAEGIAQLEAPDLLEPSSAGLAPLGSVADLTVKTLERNGYYARDLSSKRLTPEAWQAADIVINMSGYARQSAFPDWSKVEDWKIADPYGADPKIYQRIFEEIQSNVWTLISRLREERQFAVQSRAAPPKAGERT